MLKKAGSQVKSEEYVYKGPLLIPKQDNIGLVTIFQYDRAGRKIKETIGGLKTIEYDYDDFSRLIKKGQGGRVELFEHNWLNRLTSKMVQDTNGTLLSKESYEYDSQGNQIKKNISQSLDKTSKYIAAYNSDGTLRCREDPLNQKTSYEYNHSYMNMFGQFVQERTILDPLKRPTQEIQDSHHRLAARSNFRWRKADLIDGVLL